VNPEGAVTAGPQQTKKSEGADDARFTDADVRRGGERLLRLELAVFRLGAARDEQDGPDRRRGDADAEALAAARAPGS
jgi:hypothetical protein